MVAFVATVTTEALLDNDIAIIGGTAPGAFTINFGAASTEGNTVSNFGGGDVAGLTASTFQSGASATLSGGVLKTIGDGVTDAMNVTSPAAGPFVAQDAGTGTDIITQSGTAVLPSGQLYFTIGNNVPTSTLNRVNQIGVSGTTTIGTPVDLINGGQQTFGNGTTVISLPGIAVDPAAGKFFINDTNSNATFNKIWQGNIASPGTALTQIGSTATVTTQVQGLAIDEPNGNLYYAMNASTPGSIGIYEMSEAGGTPVQVVAGFTSAAHALFQLALDVPDNLVFFADSPGLTSVSTLWAGNLLNHTETALTTSAKGSRLEGVTFNDGTIYWSTLNGGTIANNNILSSRITVTGTGSLATASLGTISTLYAGAATGNGTIANTPISLAVDPVAGVLYSGSNIITGGTNFAIVNAGTVTGGSSMTTIFSSAFGGTATAGAPTLALTFESIPTIAAGGSVTFTSGGAAITVDPTASVTNPSGFNLAGATVAITGGTFTNDGDTLTATTAGTSISATFSNETLTLSGDDTLAHYKQVLDSVAFKSTAADPGDAGANPARTVTWTVSDGVIVSSISTNTIQINTAPAITGTAAGQTVNDNATDHPFSGVTIADPDSGATETVTITLQAGTLQAGGSASDANGMLSGTGLTRTGTGVYTLTTGTPAAVTTTLDALTFTPTARQVAPGSTVTTGMLMSVTDGVAASPTTDQATTVIATAVNTTLVYGQTIVENGIVATSETVSAGILTLLNGATTAGTIAVGTSLSTGDFTLRPNGTTSTNVIVSSVFGTYVSGVTLLTNPSAIDSTAHINNASVAGKGILGPSGTAWTVTNAGTIAETGNSGVAIFLTTGGTLLNSGVVAGLSTAAAVYLGGPGSVTNQTGGTITAANRYGIRVFGTGNVTNNGTIQAYGAGITGDQLMTVINTGVILGTGTGSAGVNPVNGGSVTNSASGTIIAAQYGIDIDAAAGMVSNSGTIEATTGRGIYLASGTVVNSGLITGGSGTNPAVYIYSAGNVTNQAGGRISGGIGVYFFAPAAISNETVNNAGTIIGTGGTAVSFGQGTNRLIDNPGAVFTGAISAGTAGSSVMELTSAAGAGTLYGFGTTVTNFTSLVFDTGAQWTVGGNASTGGLGTIAITGFTSGNTIDLTGFAAVSETFASNALVLTDSATAHATLHVEGSFSTGNFTIASDGGDGTDITEGTTMTVGHTITGTYATGVTLTSTAASNPVTVTGTARVSANTGVNLSSALYGQGSVAGTNTWTVTNYGTIIGGGTNAHNAIKLGAGGKYIANGVVINKSGGLITATNGYGVLAYGPLTVTNNSGATINAGEDGMFSFGGTLVNNGVILAGNVGDYVSGSGVGFVTNTGTITGAEGVWFQGVGTVTNSGTIIGTASQGSVYFQSSTGSSRLIVNPGAVFNGSIHGFSSASDVIELAGTAAGTLAGWNGVTITNFKTLQFDTGAHWKVAGSNATVVSGGTTTATGLNAPAITGFTIGDTIDLTGFAATSETFASNALVLTNAASAHATLHVQGSFTSGNFFLASDGAGGVNITEGAVVLGHTITGAYATGVTLSSAVNSDPFTIKATARIAGAFSGTTTSIGAALYGVAGTAWTITNYGSISNTNTFRAAAIELGNVAGHYANNGIIINKSGGIITGAQNGIRAVGATSVTNAAGGTISAGQDEAIGLYEARGTVVNYGVVLSQGLGGYNGISVLLYDGGTIVNHAGGTLSSVGGVVFGGYHPVPGVYYNAGRAEYAGTLNNAGTIIGTGPNAVRFYYNNSDNLLITNPGAVFSGAVSVGAGTLELASGSGIGTISGLGTSFTDFGDIQFDTGARWVLSGSAGGIGTAAILGFAAGDTIDLTGFAAVSRTFVSNALVLTDAGNAHTTLQIQGSLATGNFVIAGDGSTGTDVTFNAASALVYGQTIDVAGTVATSETVTAGVMTLFNGGSSAGTINVGTSLATGDFTVRTDGAGGTDVIVSSVFGTYASGVTLLTNPTTIDSSATITNAAGKGVVGPSGTAWTLTNLGTITETTGGSTGVSLASGGTVTNSGKISALSYGVYLRGSGAVTNLSAGTIIASAGYGVLNAAEVTNDGTFIASQAAIYGVSGATVTNTGALHSGGGSRAVIILPFGGYVTNSGAGIIGGPVGVYVNNVAGTVNNSGGILATTGDAIHLRDGGTIINNATGVLAASGASAAVYIETAAGTVTNAGTIESTLGPTGAAVLFRGPGGRVIDNPGAVFIGSVQGASGGTTVMELTSAAGAGTISGFGTSVTNFTSLVFDAGARWTVAGNASATGLGTLGITGFATGDTIDLTGFVAVSETFASNALVLTDGGGAHQTLSIQGSLATTDFIIAGDGDGGTDIVLGVPLIYGQTIDEAGIVAASETVTAGIMTLRNGGGTVVGTIAVGTSLATGDFFLHTDGAGGTNVIVSSIFGTYNTGVTLVTNPTTITTAAGISESLTGATGVYGPAGTAWTLTNQGQISASALAKYGISFASPGAVINAATGTITSDRYAIMLKAGGVVLNQSGGVIGGNEGVLAGTGPISVVNAGVIEGGATTFGGIGVYLGAGGLVTNQSGGTISGYQGVEALNDPTAVVNSGQIAGNTTASEGIGVNLSAGGSVTNQLGGTIGGYRGIEVNGAAGTVENAGLIASYHTSGNAGGVYLRDGGSVTNQFGGTITGYYGVKAATDPATVVNAGIVAGLYTAHNAQGIFLAAGGSVTNLSTGTISGDYNAIRITGGSGTVDNLGFIHSNDIPGQNGGVGIYLADGGIVINGAAGGTVSTAFILGYNNGVRFGASGAGTLTNYGTVSGDPGNPAVAMASGTIVNGPSGATGALIEGGDQTNAVLFTGVGSVANYGTIAGFENPGDTAIYYGIRLGGTAGGVSNLGTSALIENYIGVYATMNDTITNAGTIASNFNGGAYALVFGGGTNRLILDPGARFIGAVSGGGPVTVAPTGNTQVIGTANGIGVTTLELASASSAGTLSGLGTSIVNLSSLVFDNGAQWTVRGNDSANGLGTLGISGFTYGDTLDLTGFAAVSRTFASNALVLTDGGGAHATLAIQGSFATGNFNITSDGSAGTEIVFGRLPLVYGQTIDETGIVATSETVAAGVMTLRNGGSVAGTIDVGTSLNSGDFTLASDGSGGTNVIVSTVFGSYTSGVTLLTNPTTIASTANISATGGNALFGAGGSTGWTINNYGVINGGTNANGIQLGGGGSGGVPSGIITNAAGGTIAGRYGMRLYNDSTVSIVNLAGGTIAATGTNADRAIDLEGGAGTVINSGLISAQTSRPFDVGVELDGGGTVINSATGTITGGWGVLVSGAGTVENAGTIRGVYSNEFAVALDNGDRLIVDPGAVFIGAVNGGRSGGGSTLELASAASAGTLTATNFTHFSTIDFDTGAAWTIVGATTALSGAIVGFTFGDAIDLTGFAAVSGTFASNSLVLSDGIGNFDTLAIQGTFASGNFHLSGDGGGGTDIVFGALPLLYGQTIDEAGIVVTSETVTAGVMTLMNGVSPVGTIMVGPTLSTGDFLLRPDGTGGTNVIVSSIFGTYTSGVTLVTNPTTIAGTASITGTVASAAGVIGPSGTAWTLTNQGLVSETGAGGKGISFASNGSITNAGIVNGAGVGIQLNAGGLVSNQASGTISGVKGIYGQTAVANVMNSGSISGNVTSGSGIAINAGGSVTNLAGGTISGSYGINASSVAFTVVNSGSIGDGTSLPTGAAIALKRGGQIANLAGGQIIAGLQGIYIGGAAGTIVNAGSVGGGPTGNGVIFASAGAVTNQSGGVITAKYGIRAVSGAVTVTNAGSIGGNLTSGGGVNLATGGSVTNQSGGTITGQQAVLVTSGTVTNAGSIGGNSAIATGAGVRLSSGGSFTNQSGGLVTGFAGVISNAAATVVNTGSIGGNLVSGRGVSLTGSGSVTNQGGGVITGFVGILATGGATVVNAGSIGGTTAVVFGSGVTNRLVVDPGATFSGTVNGGNTIGAISISTLELTSAASAGTLTALGSQFINFAQTTIDTSANWIFNGINSIAAGVTLANAGTLTDSGTLLNSGTMTGDMLRLSGGALTNQTGGLLTATYIYGVAAGGTDTVVNQGTLSTGETSAIYLAAAGNVSNAAGGVISAYGAAVKLKGVGSTLSNLGRITSTAPGPGGYGVYLRNGGLVTNGQAGTGTSTALITGYYGLTFKTADVVNAYGTLINFGTVIGTGTTAEGVLLSNAGTVFNGQNGATGALIEGGRFGISSDAGQVANYATIIATGTGGADYGIAIQGTGSVGNFGTAALIEGYSGVLIGTDGTVTNFGTIESSFGTSGIAVEFTDGNSRLIDNPGAVFVGSIFGGNGGTAVMELASAASAGTISGFGTSITNFTSLVFDPGARWTVEGDDAANGLGTLHVSGFAAGDTIDLLGFVAVSDTFASNLLTLTDGGGAHQTLTIPGTFKSANFQFGTDGAGGTDITFQTAPVIAAGGTVTFLGGSGVPVVLDGGLTVADPESATLAGGTISIGTGFLSGDTLSFVNQGGISGVFDSGTGALTLSGTAGVANYQTALASITYSFLPSGNDPTGGGTDPSRVIDWMVNDGTATSPVAVSVVDVTHVGPTVTASGTVSFSGGGVAVVLDPSLTLEDPDSADLLTSGTVSVVGFIPGDVLSANLIGLAFITHAFNSATGVLTLTGSDTLAHYQAALDSVKYSFNPANGDPTGGGGHTGRTIDWSINDGVAGSNVGTSSLIDVHVAPTVTASGTVTFTVGGPTVVLDSTIAIGAPDSFGHLVGGTISVSTDFFAGDMLNFVNQNGITGLYNSSTGVLALSGTATTANYTTALASVTYSSSAGDPANDGDDPIRGISWSVNDGVDVSGIATTTVDIGFAPPVISGAVAGQTVTDETTRSPFAAVSISELAPGQTETVTVSLSNPLNGTLSNVAGGKYDSKLGIYSITGSDAVVSAAVEGLVFTPTAHQVAPGSSVTTTFTIKTTDTAGGTASDATTTVGATAVNDAPVIDGAVSGQTVTDETTLSPFADVSIGDVDFGQTETVTVALSNPLNGTLSNVAGGSYDSKLGVYSITGTDAAVTAAIDGLVFTPTAHQVAPGNSVTTTFTIKTSDTAGRTAGSAATTVRATAVNDPPVIAGAVSGQSMTDAATLSPFSMVSIGDVDFGQTETVNITLSNPLNGTLSNVAGGNYDSKSGVYSITGSDAVVTSAIEGLVFIPTAHQVAPGGSVTTTFTIKAADTAEGTASNAITTVAATAVNDPPIISGTVTGQTTNDEATLSPFSLVSISDAALGQTETVTIALSNPLNGTLSNTAGGKYNSKLGVYTVIGTDAAVTSAVDGLVFTPAAHQVAPGGSVTTTFTIKTTDTAGATTSNAATTVAATAINDPPVIAGAIGGQTVTDETTLSPFPELSISDVDFGQTETVTVSLSNPLDGTLSNVAGGGYDSKLGVYSVTGTDAAVTSAIDGLVFTPTAHQVAPGSSVTTTFTIKTTDTAGGTASNVTTTVGATAVNDPPVISGVISGQTTTDEATLSPFSTVSIGDVDFGQTETVTITLSNPLNGALSNLAGGSYDAKAGVYSITGTDAAVSAAIDGLVFTPTAHQVAPGGSVTTTFTIKTSDTAGGTASNAITTVAATGVNDPPVISGVVSGQTTSDAATSSPFASVSISDAASGQIETVTVTLSDPLNGMLSNVAGGDYNSKTGVYTITGGDAVVSGAVDGLVFTPTAHQVTAGASVTTTFTIKTTDTAGATTSNANTTVAVTAEDDPPLIAGTVANQAVPNETASNPFALVTVTDPDFLPIETITVTLSTPGNGTLSNLSTGGYDASTGVYSVTGIPGADTAALRALVFTPIEQPNTAVVTTGFAISPGEGGVTDTTTNVTSVRQILGLAAVPPNQIAISVSPGGTNFAAPVNGQTNEAVVIDPVEGATYTVPTGYQALFLGGTADATLSDASVGDALLVANSGNDELIADAPDDTLAAGSGSDSLVGGSFDSTAIGGSGPATVFAGSGVMRVFEGSGPIVFGGNGNAGSTILGGSGPGASPLTANLTGQNQTVSVGGSASTITAAGSGNSVVGGSSTLNVTVSGTANTIQAGSGSSTVVSGGSGTMINGGSGPLVVMETGDNNTISGGASPTTVTASTATFVVGGSGGLTFVGGLGTATVVGGSGANTVTAGAGGLIFNVGASDNATVNSGSGTVSIFGAPGTTVNLVGTLGGSAGHPNYAVAGGGSETVNASGSAGSDWLSVNTTVTSSAATLIAGSGNDTLIAGSAPGSTTMTGGNGSDAFVFFKQAVGGAHDVINDFTAGDSVFIEGYGAGSAATLQNASSVSANGLTLTLSDGTTVTFSNLTSQHALDGHVQYG